mmetsp:Transcript_36942/g.95374  ORF Transcript_36942/g.95374 Transcript_36942/m.95374 type:complete len:616 (-) Transcript_36942:26-1873(-)
MPASDAAEQRLDGDEQAKGRVPHVLGLAEEQRPSDLRDRGVAVHHDDAQEEENGVHKPDPMRGREDAPERVHLAVRLGLRGLQGHLPVHSRERCEAPPVRQLEEACAVVQQQAIDDARGVAEELVPVVVVRNVGRQEVLQLRVQLLLVLVVRVHVDALVPLVEDDGVDGTDDLREEEAAVEDARLARHLRHVVQVLAAQRVRGERQFRDEVDDLGHEADVPALTPDQQVRHDLRELCVHGLGLLVTGAALDAVTGLEALALALQDVPRDAAQRGHRVLVARRDAGRRVVRELVPPPLEAVEHLSVQVAKRLHEQAGLVDLHEVLDRAVRHHRALRAPQGQEVVVLVPRAVRLEVEHLPQPVEEAGGGGGEVARAGQHAQAGGLEPCVLELVAEGALRRAVPRHDPRRSQTLQRGLTLQLRDGLLLLRAGQAPVRDHGADKQQHEDAEGDREQHGGDGPFPVRTMGCSHKYAALAALHHDVAPCVDGQSRRHLGAVHAPGLRAERLCVVALLLPDLPLALAGDVRLDRFPELTDRALHALAVVQDQVVVVLVPVALRHAAGEARQVGVLGHLLRKVAHGRGGSGGGRADGEGRKKQRKGGTMHAQVCAKGLPVLCH